MGDKQEIRDFEKKKKCRKNKRDKKRPKTTATESVRSLAPTAVKRKEKTGAGTRGHRTTENVVERAKARVRESSSVGRESVGGGGRRNENETATFRIPGDHGTDSAARRGTAVLTRGDVCDVFAVAAFRRRVLDVVIVVVVVVIVRGRDHSHGSVKRDAPELCHIREYFYQGPMRREFRRPSVRRRRVSHAREHRRAFRYGSRHSIARISKSQILRCLAHNRNTMRRNFARIFFSLDTCSVTIFRRHLTLRL